MTDYSPSRRHVGAFVPRMKGCSFISPPPSPKEQLHPFLILSHVSDVQPLNDLKEVGTPIEDWKPPKTEDPLSHEKHNIERRPPQPGSPFSNHGRQSKAGRKLPAERLHLDPPGRIQLRLLASISHSPYRP